MSDAFSNIKRLCGFGLGLISCSTGLSMIPASLVVVLTITMAVGTKIMVGRNVIVRKLDSLEALGAVTNVCSDKTGTLTQGKMVVKKAWVVAEGTKPLIVPIFTPVLTHLRYLFRRRLEQSI